jgi:hypothetical protein
MEKVSPHSTQNPHGRAESSSTHKCISSSSLLGTLSIPRDITVIKRLLDGHTFEMAYRRQERELKGLAERAMA